MSSKTTSTCSSTKTTLEQKKIPKWLKASIGQRTTSYVQKEVEKLTSTSRFIDSSSSFDESSFALFRRSELQLGNLLGSGSFSSVYEITGFDTSSVIETQKARNDLKQTALTSSGTSKYVIKHLRKDLLKRQSKFHHVAVDLVMESKMLAQLNHPNIVKIHGWAADGCMAFSSGLTDGYFLILDRLAETLAQRIRRWKQESGPVEKQLAWNFQSRFYAEKLDYACQIADAIHYMHSNDIIYRDLKPDNIGFKDDHTVQLFDFGLCRELPEPSPHPDDAFLMTAVGTRRYMAPEIMLGSGYNLKADVYSWTLVFHEMVSLQKPYELHNDILHRLLVCEEGSRPNIQPDWPVEIQDLCRDGWAHQVQDRLTMSEVCDRLTNMVGAIGHQQLYFIYENPVEQYETFNFKKPSNDSILTSSTLSMFWDSITCSFESETEKTFHYASKNIGGTLSSYFNSDMLFCNKR